MAFNSFGEFLAMGGHGLYVWLAYGVALGVLIFNLLSPKLIKKRLIEDMKRRERRGEL